MRNRWFHRAILHTPETHKAKQATWLELFYDFTFVAAFIQLANSLDDQVSRGGPSASLLPFAGVFAALWVAWTGYTFFVNRFTRDDFGHRLNVLLQMFAVGGMALSAPEVLEGNPNDFCFFTGAALLAVAVMYLRAFLEIPDARSYTRYWGLIFTATGVVWIVSGFLEPPLTYAVWAFATVGLLCGPVVGRGRKLTARFPLDFRHLGQRYGLLTLIVLGLTFVNVLGGLAATKGGLELYLESGVALLIICAVWWIYFDDVAGARIRSGRVTWLLWFYSHLPLQLGITALGVGVRRAVEFSWEAPAPDHLRWLLTGSLAVVFFSVSAIDSVTERRNAELSDRSRINMRLGSALLLLVLAPAGRTMSGGVFLTLAVVLAGAQVLFDMMMAPFETTEASTMKATSTAELARQRESESSAESPRRRRDLSEAVLKGAPTELRSDLYFFFIGGSWVRLFVAFTFVFVVSNVFFAALYVLEPGSISDIEDATFLEAFFFSVQTMSTIGYGAMSPGSNYGEWIATIEAAVSIIGVAVVTGVVFAKVSRPKSSVLFSRNVLVTTMYGKPVLNFRVGNARGNDVVDATMSFTAILDELTPEGHHLRKLVNLPLTRDRSPMFVLSWSVMHEVSDDSPLADIDWDNVSNSVVAFVATLVGHDGTYGQTIYARHVYYSEDLRRNERFVDIISELEDGRLMIDYEKFHATEPDD